jgi:hypothetical protein
MARSAKIEAIKTPPARYQSMRQEAFRHASVGYSIPDRLLLSRAGYASNSSQS